MKLEEEKCFTTPEIVKMEIHSDNMVIYYLDGTKSNSMLYGFHQIIMGNTRIQIDFHEIKNSY